MTYLILGGDKVRTFKYIWRYKWYIILATIALIISIRLDLKNPVLIKDMIDKVIIGGQKELMSKILYSILIIAISRAVLGYIKEFTFDYYSTKVNRDIKVDLFNHIQTLSYSYFDSMNTGELMSRMTGDVENIWRVASFGLSLFIENTIYFIITIPILFKINWKLSILCLIPMPFIAWCATKLEDEIDDNYEEISDQGALMNTTAEENIAGVRLVKAFAREKYEILKFLDMNKKNYKLNMKQNNIVAKYFPLIEFLSNSSIVMMVTIGGISVIKGNMSVGTLVAFNSYLWMMIWPMRMVGWLTNMMGQAKASAKKINKIFDTVPEIKDCDNPISLEKIDGHIVFDNVSFKYNEEYVLKNINIDIKPGTTVAIMGATGSGKSSLINLIGRFYDVTEGKILVNGHDVKTLKLSDLRKRIATVSQDTFLFSDTVAENVRIGKEDAIFEEVKKACSEACADDFIEELSDGYDSIIGERGIGLSGGQKQRISIARALIKDADLLILDDSTSALDMETEYSLLKNIYSRDKMATTFIIAHRISAVKNADEIIFLQDGSIAERGSHEELLKKKGKYYEIYCEQFKDFEDVESEVV